MSAHPNGGLDPNPPKAGGLLAWSRWRFTVTAVGWILLAMVGAACLAIVAGVTVSAIEGPAAVNTSAANALFTLIGELGVQLVSLCVALGRARAVGQGDR